MNASSIPNPSINVILNSRMNKSTTVSNISGNQQLNYLFITPAVSIDQNFDNGNTHYFIDEDINLTGLDAQNFIQNSNLSFCREHQQANEDSSTILSGNRSNLIPKRSRLNSWKWCTILCSAIKCFGNSSGFSAAAATAATNTSTCTNNNCMTSLTTNNHVLDLIVSNETQHKNQNIPIEL